MAKPVDALAGAEPCSSTGRKTESVTGSAEWFSLIDFHEPVTRPVVSVSGSSRLSGM
jgi:hypothetical protein